MANVDLRRDHNVYSALPIEEGVVGKFIDRVGDKYGKLLVLRRSDNSHSNKVVWECKCACGNITYVTSGALVTGNTASCGCGVLEANTKHGGTGKRSYNTWRAMMRRCYTKHDKDYPRYGGVGVTVYNRWHDYSNFATDMGEPEKGLTLDRIDPYGDYTPNNCRWAGVVTQARNIRVPTRNKSGYIGVHKRGDKWMAEITVKGKKFYSKCYTAIGEAIIARKNLERTHWGVDNG